MATVGIIDRVSALPMVQSTYGKVSEAYCCAKERNFLFNIALSTVEASVQVMATSAQPIVQTLEKPIAHADAFACRQFDYLEEKVPAIQATPEEVIEGTKHFVSEKLRTGADVVTRSPVGRLVSSRLDYVLDMTEGAVDYLLPEEEPVVEDEAQMRIVPDDDDEEEEEAPEPTPLTRMSTISNKVSTRTRGLAARQLTSAQQRADKALQQLRSNLVLIGQAQEQLKVQRERLQSLVAEQKANVREQVATNSQRIISAAQCRAGNAYSATRACLPNVPATVLLPGGAIVELAKVTQAITELPMTIQSALESISVLVTNPVFIELQRPVTIALAEARALNSLVVTCARGYPVTNAMLDRATSMIATISCATESVGTYLRSTFDLPAMTSDSAQDLQMEEEAISTKPPAEAASAPAPKKAESPPVEDEEEEEEGDGSTEI